MDYTDADLELTVTGEYFLSVTILKWRGNIAMAHSMIVKIWESSGRMFKRELCYLTKQLANRQIDFLLKAPLNFRCEKQPKNCHSHQNNGKLSYVNAANCDRRCWFPWETQNHPSLWTVPVFRRSSHRPESYLLSTHQQFQGFCKSLWDDSTTASFSHHPIFFHQVYTNNWEVWLANASTIFLLSGYSQARNKTHFRDFSKH